MGIIVSETKSAPQCPRGRPYPPRDCVHQGIHLDGEPGPAGCGQAIGIKLWPATRMKATLDPTLVNRVMHLCYFLPARPKKFELPRKERCSNLR